MSVLLDKLIASRESWVDVDGFRFKIRRPTEMELIRLRSKDDQVEIGLEAIKIFVFDWAKVAESDVIPGGASDFVPFDRELYGSWIEDRPHLWPPIGKEIFAKIKAEQERKQADEKNL